MHLVNGPPCPLRTCPSDFLWRIKAEQQGQRGEWWFGCVVAWWWRLFFPAVVWRWSDGLLIWCWCAGGLRMALWRLGRGLLVVRRWDLVAASICMCIFTSLYTYRYRYIYIHLFIYIYLFIYRSLFFYLYVYMFVSCYTYIIMYNIYIYINYTWAHTSPWSRLIGLAQWARPALNVFFIF